MQKGGIRRCKFKGQIDKGGHYDVEMKGWMQKGGIMMCKFKGRMEKDIMMCKLKVDEKGGIMMCNLTGRMDK